MRNLILSSCLFLFASGCHGKVKLEELDKFGRVDSAVWFHYQQNVSGGEDDEWHSLVMSTEGRLCKKMQDIMPEAADLGQDIDDVYEAALNGDATVEDICKQYKSSAEAMAELTEDAFGKGGLNYLSLRFFDPDEQNSYQDPPEEGDYESYDAQGDNDDPYFTGSVNYIEENPWESAASGIDCDDDAWQQGFFDDLDDAIEDYRFQDGGDATVTEKGDEKLKVELDGKLEEVEDDDTDDKGAIELKGTFKYCEVEFEGSAWFYL